MVLSAAGRRTVVAAVVSGAVTMAVRGADGAVVVAVVGGAVTIVTY